jgi:hypothetical protein
MARRWSGRQGRPLTELEHRVLTVIAGERRWYSPGDVLRDLQASQIQPVLQAVGLLRARGLITTRFDHRGALPLYAVTYAGRAELESGEQLTL